MKTYVWRHFLNLFLYILICLILLPNISRAQSYAQDALRFSQTTISGTARIQGIAGANTALGGDMSSISSNPAGLGFFTKSEFSFSPGLIATGSASDYDTQSNPINPNIKDNKTALNISNLGLVFYTGKDAIEGGKWRGGTFGISMNRVNSFQNTFSYAGINENTSKTDFLVEQSTGIKADAFENPTDQEYGLYSYQRAAYFAYLINPFDLLQNGNTDPNNTDYFSDFRDENENLLGSVKQSGVVNTKGSQNQWNFSYGGNYNDKIYFGLSAGLTSLNFTRSTTYKESMDSEIAYLAEFTETDNLKTRGTGFNVSAGVIVRPVDIIRIGVSFSSPTWYSLREEFGTTFNAQSYRPSGNSLTTYTESTLPGSYNYRLTTPMRVNVGGAIFIGKYGFISADAEYIPYNSIRLKDTDNSGSFNVDNQNIEKQLKNVWNFRVGAEGRLDIFRVRGGFAYQADPYNQVDKIDRRVLNFTGGFGVRLTDWYLDLALVRSQYNSAYQPYNLDPNGFYRGLAPITTTKNGFWNGVISVGFYF